MFQAKLNSTKKPTKCKFCALDIISKNFVRHIETHHHDEKEVKKILEYPKSSKERRLAFSLLRNSTNFDLYIKGELRPYRETKQQHTTLYYPCIYCKGLYKKAYLRRHTKRCPAKNNNSASNVPKCYVSNSQTMAACAMDTTNVISLLNLKEQVPNIKFLIWHVHRVSS